jgi:hypothetical protein
LSDYELTTPEWQNRTDEEARHIIRTLDQLCEVIIRTAPAIAAEEEEKAGKLEK